MTFMYKRREDGAYVCVNLYEKAKRNAKAIAIITFLSLVGIGCATAYVKARSIAYGDGLDNQSSQILVDTVQIGTVTSVQYVPPCVEIGERAYDCSERIEDVKRFKAWELSQKNYPSFKATVTAYNSVPGQTDASPCIAANGKDICALHKQGISTCAAAMPFGIKLEVDGFGTCIVMDRLAPKYANRVDIHMGGADSIAKAKAWGIRKNTTIRILPN